MPALLSPREMPARLVALPTVPIRSNLDLVDAVAAEHGVAAARPARQPDDVITIQQLDAGAAFPRHLSARLAARRSPCPCPF